VYAWNLEGVKVFQTVSAVLEVNTATIRGTGIYEPKVGVIPFSWEALALPHGWYITVISSSGRRGEFQGSTFNLPLEVATGARRLL
jgi:hypothetical protein